MLTGIQTGVFFRETKRRDEETAKYGLFQDKLSQDQVKANELLSKLDSKWEPIHQIKNPYDLHEVMRSFRVDLG